MAKSTKVKLKATREIHPIYKTPKRLYDIAVEAGAGNPRTNAETFLKKIADELKIKPDLSQLKFDQVKTSILGKHVLFQQYEGGKSISGAWIRVDINPANEIYNVQNDLVPDTVLAKSSKKAKSAAMLVTVEAASATALQATGSTDPAHTIVATETVILPVLGVLHEAWKIVVSGTKPRGEWKVYVDAETGAVLQTVDLLKHADGRGRVFDPHPVATLNDPSLSDTSPIPDGAYFEVVLKDLDGSGHLEGPFVSTSTTNGRVKRANLDFRFKRSDRAFKEVMVYFHIDRVQRYIQELGFTNVLNKSIAVNIDGLTDDNSNYSPLTKSLTFGTGGVDDAEDAEIVLHEYGHAMQDDMVNGFGATHEGGSMGEAFGDYWAASFYSEHKPVSMQASIGNWDATFYSGANPPFLRRLDSNKLYPRDMKNEVHDDGEIWSACLWLIRKAIGRRTADILILAHHSLLTPQSQFEDAANALITTDGQLNAGRNEVSIRQIFVERGILPNAKRNNNRAGVSMETIHSSSGGRNRNRVIVDAK